jgi:DUF1009 family protein
LRETLGLIAGNGTLPLLVSEGARKEGYRLAAVGHIGETRKDLKRRVDVLKWVAIGQLEEIVRFLKEENARKVILAGAVSKTHFFSRLRPDARALKVLSRLRDRKDDAILRAVAEEIETEGMEVVSPVPFLAEHLAWAGCWTERKPTEREQKDIAFGLELARQMGALDVGQSVVVKDGIILAVEAIEGTDAAIRRGGKLGRGDVTVVKICKPNQDQRVDLPVIGPSTVRWLKKAGGGLLAVEAGKTIVLKKETVLAEAERNRLCLIGF